MVLAAALGSGAVPRPGLQLNKALHRTLFARCTLEERFKQSGRTYQALQLPYGSGKAAQEAGVAPRVASADQPAGMRVVTVPVLSDNYAYLLINSDGQAAAVDPAAPDKVLWAAHSQNALLTHVLTTHWHKDHAGGNKALAKQLPELEIIGSRTDGVDACTRSVADGEVLQLGSISIKCLATPFHTKGHVCYLCTEQGSGQSILFTGDTLFVGGVGRCFDGTPEQMRHSLLEVIAKLPPRTLIYCGHEYTVSNLEWAASIDGESEAIRRKLEWAKEQRAAGRPTVPSTVGEELQHNLFLRCMEPAVQRAVGASDAVSALAELRRQKDNWGVRAKLMTQLLPAARWLGMI